MLLAILPIGPVGKSAIIDLMCEMMGEYATAMKSTLLTGKMANAEAGSDTIVGEVEQEEVWEYARDQRQLWREGE